MPMFGCVADDFTGASDAASFLVKGGMSVQLFNGVPQEASRPADGVQAVVVALKSRTQQTEAAVDDSVRALKWMQRCGVRQFYSKYCSTFDSTPSGNIGPIADAALELLGAPYTILCPALPVNGRVVREGKLYVNGVPLHESHMRHHPLTPMWDSRIAELMRPQSKYPCVELHADQLSRPAGEVRAALAQHAGESGPFYVVPDYETDADGERIVELFGDLPLLTGGSGILEPLARRLCGGARLAQPDVRAKGPALLLAGSCSKATLGQIARFQAIGGISYKLDPAAMLEGRQTADDAWNFVRIHAGETVLVYSSDTAQNVRQAQQLGQSRVAELLEQTAAELAQRAMENGYQRIIVAGGETSGAVTKRLGFASYQIGDSVAPGVPVMIPAERPDVRLVLKSGNFGQETFFEDVLRMTQAQEAEHGHRAEP